MDDNSVIGESPAISISVLAGETVNSLLNSWVTDLSLESSADLQNKINVLIEQVKKISPQDIESKNISQEMISGISEILTPFKEDAKITDSFFNTLNLCIVGLGTRLKSINNE